MIEHKIDPNEFLSYVHDIDHDLLKPDLRLGNAIRDLPGKRVIYTNGTVRYAENVLKRLGITELFEDIFDVRQGSGPQLGDVQRDNHKQSRSRSSSARRGR